MLRRLQFAQVDLPSHLIFRPKFRCLVNITKLGPGGRSWRSRSDRWARQVRLSSGLRAECCFDSSRPASISSRDQPHNSLLKCVTVTRMCLLATWAGRNSARTPEYRRGGHSGRSEKTFGHEFRGPAKSVRTGTDLLARAQNLFGCVSKIQIKSKKSQKKSCEVIRFILSCKYVQCAVMMKFWNVLGHYRRRIVLLQVTVAKGRTFGSTNIKLCAMPSPFPAWMN